MTITHVYLLLFRMSIITNNVYVITTMAHLNLRRFCETVCYDNSTPLY